MGPIAWGGKSCSVGLSRLARLATWNYDVASLDRLSLSRHVLLLLLGGALVVWPGTLDAVPEQSWLLKLR